MNQHNTFWNPEKDQILTQLYLEKKSNSFIGDVLGTTRNAVAGRAFRIGLKKEKQCVAGQPRIRKKTRLTEAEKAIRKAPKLERQIVKGNQIPPLIDSALELTPKKCAYPYGDNGFQFCGRPRERGSFCEFHASLCYVEPHRRSTRPSYRWR